MMKKRVLGQACVEVTELVAILGAAPVGTLLTYKSLSQAVGVDVRIKRHLLDSARRLAMRDHHCVYAAVVNEGIRRLDDVETVSITSESRRKKIRTQSRLGARELGAVNYERLPTEFKVAHNVGQAIFSAVYEGTSRGAVKTLTNQIENNSPPRFGDILKSIGWDTDK